MQGDRALLNRDFSFSCETGEGKTRNNYYDVLGLFYRPSLSPLQRPLDCFCSLGKNKQSGEAQCPPITTKIAPNYFPIALLANISAVQTAPPRTKIAASYHQSARQL